jgi:hypothetical protein
VIRLLAAAGAFTGTVVGGFLIGLLLYRLTGAGWWIVVGLFGGLAIGIGAVVAALRPFLRSN